MDMVRNMQSISTAESQLFATCGGGRCRIRLFFVRWSGMDVAESRCQLTGWRSVGGVGSAMHFEATWAYLLFAVSGVQQGWTQTAS